MCKIAQTSQLGKLSNSEMEVMHEIWAMTQPVTVSRLLEIFAARRKWKTSTLSTIMDRLIEKGFLSKELKGKTNIYKASLTEEEYKEHETKVFMATIHNSSVKSFFASLMGNSKMDSGQIDEIRSWFLEQERDK